MRNAEQVVLIARGLAGVEADIRTKVQRATQKAAVLEGSPKVHLGLVAVVVVEAIDGLPVVLRQTAAQVGCTAEPNLAKSWKAAGKIIERSRPGRASQALYLSHLVAHA